VIEVKTTNKGLKELQAKASEAGFGAQVSVVAARGIAGLVRQHLYDLDARGNRLGGPRTNFYKQAGDSIEVAPMGAGTGVTITKIGVAQRWLGGTIAAGRGISSKSGGPTRYLAIPAVAEAHGKTPSQFEDLVFIPRDADRAMLVEKLQGGLKGAAKKLKVMFWLVEKVTQSPDPTVMPSEEEMVGVAEQAAGSYLARRLQ
jgi:hypothetical protein